MEQEFREFLKRHVNKVEPLHKEVNLSYWNAAVSGRKADYEKVARLELQLRKIYANRSDFEKVRSFKESGRVNDPLLRRQLDLLYLSYLENQIRPDLLQKLVSLGTEIENIFNTFRAEIDGKQVTNNEILDILRHGTDLTLRQKAWEGSKQIGPVVATKLLHLVRLRNEAAVSLGFANFYEMSLVVSEQEPAEMTALFDSLDKKTEAPFRKQKQEMDAILAGRYGILPEEIKPWHYEDPFFQESPHVFEVDFNQFFKNQDVVDLAREFYAGIGLPADPILKRSDLYEKPGKDQHAFCIDIDRKGDVRVLANVKNDEYWMSTMLHELGHGVYDYFIDRRLPFLLRTHAHIFVTEAVAMFFGRLSRSADWLRKMVGVEESLLEPVQRESRKAQQLQQLIFSRWVQVMVNFERALYTDPEQDLNTLWWRLVEKFQLISPVTERKEAADWATKIHICTAPVYYHNYMLGELLASQMRHFLVTNVLNLSDQSDVGFVEMPEVGRYFREALFAPGAQFPWPELIQKATGEPLTPEHFVRQFVEEN